MGLQLDFAFEGFRLIRARPKLIALWGIVTLFGYGIATLVLVATAGPVLPVLSGAGAHPPDTINEAAALQALTGLLSAAPIWLLTQAVVACAVCRAGLEDGEDPFGYLRFGIREVQVLAVMAVTAMLTFMVTVSVISLAGLLGLGAAFTGVASVLGTLAGCFVQVRLSLNVPQSFVLRRVDLFGSVPLTRGSFWPLAGGYVMAFALACIVDYLGETVIRAVVAVLFGDGAATGIPDMSSLSAFVTPAHTVQLAMLLGLVMPQVSAILLGAPLAAWKALSPSVAPAAAVSRLQ